MPTVSGAGRKKYAAQQAKHSQRTPLPPRVNGSAPGARTAAIKEAVAVQQAAKPLSNPSFGKATQFYLKAEELGWKTLTKIKAGDEKRVVVARGGDSNLTGERIEIAWRSEIFVPDATYALLPGTARKVKNAAEAYRLLARSVEDAMADAPKARAERKSAATPTGPTAPAKKLPFDPKGALDDDILTAVIGRTVVWYNAQSEDFEQGEVATHRVVKGGGRVKMNTQPHITINGDERRVLSFLDPDMGYRACYVDAIQQVN